MTAQQLSPEQLAAAGMNVPRLKSGEVGKVSAGQLSKLRQEYVGRQLLGYAAAKLTPAIKWEEELRTGHDFTGRPLPWVHEKQTPKEALKHPPMGWAEYLLSKPIILSGATKYVFDQMRKSGASVTDASNLVRAFMISALVGTTAIEPKEIKEPTPHRTRYGHAQVGR